jgi:glucose/mannose-6-phosphate isomerase
MKYQKDVFSSFPDQILYSLNHYKKHNFSLDQFRNVVIGGLGGSGIGARITKNFLADKFKLPVEVVSDYFLPAYVNEKTLLLLSSYSGNTQETLDMYSRATQSGCKTIVITSGGKLQELAASNGTITYTVETGFQPRQALGYSLTYLLMIFNELSAFSAADELRAVTERLKNYEKYYKKAEDLFNSINNPNGKIVVVADRFYEAVGTRFCQQVQENAKAEAFLNIVPEANHNVIETYTGRLDTQFLFLRSEENIKVTERFVFLESLLKKNGNSLIDLTLGDAGISSIYETIFILDWLSLFIAGSKNVNSLEVPNITSLKEYLEQPHEQKK